MTFPAVQATQLLFDSACGHHGLLGKQVRKPLSHCLSYRVEVVLFSGCSQRDFYFRQNIGPLFVSRPGKMNIDMGQREREVGG